MSVVEEEMTDDRKKHHVSFRMSSSELLMLGKVCKENGNVETSDMIRKLIYDEYKRVVFGSMATR